MHSPVCARARGGKTICQRARALREKLDLYFIHSCGGDSAIVLVWHWERAIKPSEFDGFLLWKNITLPIKLADRKKYTPP